MKNRYSPPPQKPRGLPPLIVEDPFRYRRPWEDLDLSSCVNLESGKDYSRVPPIFTSDQGMTNPPDWADYSNQVKIDYFI